MRPVNPLDWRGILERAGADENAPEGSQGHSLHLLELRLAAVIDALRWYVENDAAHALDQAGNEFWIEGYERGLSALAALNSGGA